jgi:peptidyl-prolyl cis-trans isomerase D
MLGSIRKFSSSIFAKVFLFIVAIPFIFWGMGDVFRSGNQNTIVKIDNEKVSTKDFVEYLDYYTDPNEELNDILLENKLSNFIADQLLEKEIENLKVILSKNSLSKIIKNEKIFQKDGNFSRTEYEKFLITNGLSAVIFERNILNQYKKKQMIDFVSGGLLPANFLVEIIYDKINQKRNIQIVNVKNLIDKNISFSEDQVLEHYKKNKKKYIYTYKTINFKEINPLNLTGNEEFDDLFFEKIDRIDDYIVEGKNLNFILKEFNLNSASEITTDQHGKDQKGIIIENFPKKLIEKIFLQSDLEQTILTVHENKYFVLNILKDEKIQKKIDDINIKQAVLEDLKNISKRKFATDIINKINENKFNKTEFDNLLKKENTAAKKIFLKSLNDNEQLSENLVQQIYSYPEKKVILVADIGLSEVYLVYIDKVENVTIAKESEDYKKYLKLSKAKMITDLYGVYDSYLKKKYKVEINYNALDILKKNIK